MSFDLGAWFTRIGYHGSRQPTLETLTQLHLLHPCAIPFENLDVLLSRPILLDQQAIFAKLIEAGRGGYCYEQNALFAAGLQALGFQVEGLAARVLIAAPPTLPPRTHKLLLITLAGERWIADVGFGGKTLTAPLRLRTDVTQHTPHGTYQLQRIEHDYLLVCRQAADWQPLYRFTLETQYPADYEMANYYVSHWPDSHFRHHLLLSRQLTEGGALAVNNHQLSRYDAQGNLQRESVDDETLYRQWLPRFGLRLDDPHYGVSIEQFSAMMASLRQPETPRE
ncbi:N-hydroxyarylamine O-acetyltransferase [Paramixta manurensis]|uniref:N-hydroxyarylamine O-acetyltransferase n=1 Tax=Paramixta manurensis TaxID=2740817 RepID=A0A6M8U8P0_9GAMM|nr:N-hydroxyarylamine O-acetyltransferase [Erwiniaceae bacterium PD-1]